LGVTIDRQLILTVTRRCNLRCSYCPTAKDGWPSLSEADAMRALDDFLAGWLSGGPAGGVKGGGVVKLFGGEPLLVPEVVRAVLARARREPLLSRVYLSTNGLGLDAAWLDELDGDAKVVLTLSLDGRPGDHRRHRRALPNVADAYDHVMALLPRLVRMRRFVVTQTIAPAAAHAMAANFDHLLALGVHRLNLLPGYYLPWKEEQLAALAQGLDAVRARVVERWRAGQPLYLRNLFTYAPTPFFNSGLVVDADGAIHATNAGLSSDLEGLLPRTRVGTLAAPPTPAELAAKAAETNALLARELPPEVWRATRAVDRLLGRFCRSLYPEYAAFRARRRKAA
jgi:MoaA/NifB/PqqE/SkfB family radical SAM enzyme